MSLRDDILQKAHHERILWLFEHRVCDAHRAAIEHEVALTPQQFDVAVRYARDAGLERGIRLTAIYDEGYEGWWTGYPTHRLAALFEREAAKRNLAEHERNARVYQGYGSDGSIGDSAHATAAALRGNLAAIAALPEVSVEASSDWVLARIQTSIDRGWRSVSLDIEPRARRGRQVEELVV